MATVTPAQIRAGRALLGLTQAELAEAAEVGVSTVIDVERERRSVAQATIDRIVGAIERAGVEFTNGAAPGVRLRPRR